MVEEREPDDAELVSAAIRGDEGSFDVLVRRYTAMAAAIAYARTGDVEAAQDLAQDAFCEAYRNLRRLRSARKFAGWLAGIARRKAISWVRSRVRSRVELGGGREELGESSATPSGDVEADEVRSRVRDAVKGLPPGYREVVVLRCLQDCGHAEICELLGISAAALDKRLTRAKAMLREVLGDLAEEYRGGRVRDGRTDERTEERDSGK